MEVIQINSRILESCSILLSILLNFTSFLLLSFFFSSKTVLRRQFIFAKYQERAFSDRQGVTMKNGECMPPKKVYLTGENKPE